MEKYYLHLGGEQKGPFTLGQLQEMWRTGAIKLDTQFWTKAGSEWKTMEAILDLIEPPKPAAPTVTPPPATPPASRANPPSTRATESGEGMAATPARQSATQVSAPRPVPANEICN